MDWFAKAFIKSALTWLGLGITVGIVMAIHPPWVVYRTAHFHMNLLGFVAMMIFGVAYHVMPRFTGHPLHSRRLAGVHVVVANAGLALMAGGFAATPHVASPARLLVAAGGILSAVGAYAFIYNLWRTIDGPTAARTATQRTATDRADVPAARRLPLARR
jgi:cbb3-type cytochrome oxidase subunit 1